MKYAASTGCFYPDDILYRELPSDIITVDDALFAQWCNAPPGSVLQVSRGALSILPPVPPGIADLRAAKIKSLRAEYEAALAVPVEYRTKAGTTARFSTDSQSRFELERAIEQSGKAKKWPLNIWLDAEDMPVTPFTFDDLTGLSDALDGAKVPTYADLLAAIAKVDKAKSAQIIFEISLQP